MIGRRTLLAQTVGAATLLAATPLRAAPIDRFRAYAQGPWGQIHYRVYGARFAPTVVLLHKMVWSSLEFEHAQPALAALGVRSVAIDLPGYGYSDGPDHEPTAEAYADALLPVFDQLGLKQSAVLGVHTGASLAAVFADRHPDRVSRLILEGPPLFDAATLHVLLTQPPIDRQPRADGGEFARRFKEIKAALPPGSVSDASVQQATMEFFQAAPHDAYAHNAVFRYDLEAALERLRTPTLLLTNRGDVLHFAALKAKALRPDFTLVEVDFDGAQDAFDNPGPWAKAVAEHLRPAG